MAAKQVRLTTNLGDIVVELFETEAPLSTANFVQYVEDKFYDGTIFHRVINGFIVQGGGLEASMNQKKTRAPVKNEANNGLKNDTGTLAMARTNDPHSATAQFFINVSDNAFLNHRSETPDGWGYCVFGKVIEGMETVNAIKAVPTSRGGGMQDVPKDTVTITSAVIV